MATDVEKLIVALEARTRAFEAALAKANGTAEKRSRAIESRFQNMNKNISAAFRQVGASAARAFALIGGAQGLKTLSDSATRIDNSLKVAGLSGAKLEEVYQQLFAAANKNAAPIETLVGLYGRLSLVQGELGITSDQIVSFSNNIALALRVGGTSATEASGALIQLSQTLGGGVVRAEEFNSILEGAPTILQAAAAGIKQADGSVAKLRQIMLDGKLSSKAFFDGFQAGAPLLEQKVSGAVLTVDQRMTNLQTSLTNAAREFNKSTNAANTFGSAIDNMATFINSVDMDGLAKEIGDIISVLNQGATAAQNLANWIGKLSGLQGVGQKIINAFDTDGDGRVTAFGGALTIDSTVSGAEKLNSLTERRRDLEKEISDLQSRPIQRAKANGSRLDAAKRELSQIQAQSEKVAGNVLQDTINNTKITYPNAAPNLGVAPAITTKPSGSTKFTPIDISDPKYKPASTGSGGGGGGSSKSANEYQREIEQIKERTAALNQETEALAKVNPLINDNGFEVAKARAESDLLTAAQRAGIEVTPQLRASIDQLSTGYANASVAAEKLSVSQDQAKRAAEDFKDTSKDIASGFISDLRNGASASEALANSLNKVLDKLIDIGLNSIFDTGGSGGGLFGGIMKLFGFANGGIASRGKPVKTFARGGVARSASIFGEAGPEAAVPLPDGRRIPVDLRGPTLKQSKQSGLHVTFGVSADNNGNLMPFVESVSEGKVSKAAPGIVGAASQRVVPTMAAFQNDKAGGDYRL